MSYQKAAKTIYDLSDLENIRYPHAVLVNEAG
jgi:hypothetical protein